MRLVTFTKAQAPHGVGDTRLVSDEVAARLRGEKVIEGLGEAWPPGSAVKPVRPVVQPRRPVIRPTRPSGKLDLQPAE